MDARATAIFVGLAAFAGVAFAMRRPADAAAAGQGAQADDGAYAPGGASDWLDVPFVGDASDYLADSLEGVLVTQQSLSWPALRQLQQEEGFSATPYPDFKGYSIGFGHLIKAGEDLTYVTENQAQELLISDAKWAEAAVRSNVRVPLSQNQFDALVLLTYNIGAPAFKASTLVRVLNAGDYAGAAAQIERWNMAGGQVNATLVARRDRERALFEG